MCIIMLSNLWVVNTNDIIDEQKSSNFARKELCIKSFCKNISINTAKLDTSNSVHLDISLKSNGFIRIENINLDML